MGYTVYRGDLHAHSNVSSDFGPYDNHDLGGRYSFFSPACYFDVGRQRDINFVAITDHSENIIRDQTGRRWQETLIAARGAERPGFIPMIGYEVCTEDGGFKYMNVIFREIEEYPVYGHISQMKVGDPADVFLSFAEMWAQLDGKDVIGQLGVRRVGQTIDLNDFSAEERAYICVHEITSTNAGKLDAVDGSVEALRAIDAGHRFGFVGVSNSHAEETLANGQRDYATPGPGWGALTGVLLQKQLSRHELFDALRKRHVYAVVNSWPGKGDGDERIALSFSVEDFVMEDEARVKVGRDGAAKVTIEMGAAKDNSPIKRVEIWRSVNQNPGAVLHSKEAAQPENMLTDRFVDEVAVGERHAYWAQV